MGQTPPLASLGANVCVFSTHFLKMNVVLVQRKFVENTFKVTFFFLFLAQSETYNVTRPDFADPFQLCIVSC